MKKKIYNLSDYILDFLVSKKVKKVFVLTGGAIAFTIDSFSKRKDISYICVQHEQAAAMMADAYARLGPNFAVTMSTSGPGATNLITGIACSYFDSIPNLHITGQVNTYEQIGFVKSTKKSRQIGFQETDIVSIASPITKASVQLNRANNIGKVLDNLFSISQSGRQGPVLLDLPMNLQRVEVKKFINKKRSINKYYNNLNQKKIKKEIKNIIKLLTSSHKPVILSGGGVRYSKSVKKLNHLINYLKIPVVTSWSGVDTLDYDNKYYIGHVGVYGSRSGNFSVQNSDLLISIGSRLDTRITGGRPDTFARNAKIIMIDIDKGELSKRRGLTPTIEVNMNAEDFIDSFYEESKINNYKKSKNQSLWLKKCLNWKQLYPTASKKFGKSNKFVNPYLFIDSLSKSLNKNDVIIPDDGAHLTWFMQAFKVKLGQRVFSAYGNSPMGYSFPASIGASIALNKKRIICIDGDGSFQINIQELQTVVNEKLPIKIFILNNNGYGIIKQFQELYMEKRFQATGKGVSVPDYKKIAYAYNIKYYEINNDSKSRYVIKKALEFKGAVIVNVNIHPNQKIIPKLTFGSPIEDLSPKLNRSEFNNNMDINVIGSSNSVIESN